MISKLLHHQNGQVRLPVRKSDLCLILLIFLLIACGLMFVHAAARRQADAAHIAQLAAVVKKLELTDLCLFTEARYTRHLSQADMYSAFQDHPVALEHFPTGSLAGPTVRQRRLE